MRLEPLSQDLMSQLERSRSQNFRETSESLVIPDFCIERNPRDFARFWDSENTFIFRREHLPRLRIESLGRDQVLPLNERDEGLESLDEVGDFCGNFGHGRIRIDVSHSILFSMDDLDKRSHTFGVRR